METTVSSARQDIGAFDFGLRPLARDRSLPSPGRSACKLVHTHYTWDHNSRRIRRSRNDIEGEGSDPLHLPIIRGRLVLGPSFLVLES